MCIAKHKEMRSTIIREISRLKVSAVKKAVKNLVTELLNTLMVVLLQKWNEDDILRKELKESFIQSTEWTIPQRWNYASGKYHSR